VFDVAAEDYYSGKPLTAMDNAAWEFSGTISCTGVFSMRLATPSTVLPMTELVFLLDGWINDDDVSTVVFDFDTPNLSATTAGCLIILSMTTSDNRNLMRNVIWENESRTQFLIETAYYVYTTTNVTLSAPLTVASIDLGIIYESIGESFRINLKERWNVFRLVTFLENNEENNIDTRRYQI